MGNLFQGLTSVSNIDSENMLLLSYLVIVAYFFIGACRMKMKFNIANRLSAAKSGAIGAVRNVVKGRELGQIDVLESNCETLRNENEEFRNELASLRAERDEAVRVAKQLELQNKEMKSSVRSVRRQLESAGVPNDSDVCYVVANSSVYHLSSKCRGLSSSLTLIPSTVGEERLSRRPCQACAEHKLPIASIESVLGSYIDY